MSLNGVRQDVTVGIRGLLRSPGFAAAALVTLALGIGATSAIFTVVRAVLLSPLPYAEPDRRVMIWSRWISFDKTWLSDQEILDYRRLVAHAHRRGRLGHRAAEPHRRRRAGARRGRSRDRQHVRRAGRGAAAGPGDRRGRGPAQRPAGGGAGLRALAGALRRRPGDRRPAHPAERSPGGSGGRDAAGLPPARPTSPRKPPSRPSCGGRCSSTRRTPSADRTATTAPRCWRPGRRWRAPRRSCNRSPAP